MTKNGGVVVWVVGDATIKGSETGTSFKQALYFKDIGFNLHDTMLYLKDPVPLTHNRYEQAFEYMFVFSKGKPKTFNPILCKCFNVGQKLSGTRRHNLSDLEPAHGIGRRVKSKKIASNVFYYPTGSNKTTKDKIAYQHPAIFPEALARDHIVSWSNEGDVVLDPMMGSGTVAKMCELLNRRWIGVEVAEEYCKVIAERVGLVARRPRLFKWGKKRGV